MQRIHDLRKSPHGGVLRAESAGVACEADFSRAYDSVKHAETHEWTLRHAVERPLIGAHIRDMRATRPVSQHGLLGHRRGGPRQDRMAHICLADDMWLRAPSLGKLELMPKTLLQAGKSLRLDQCTWAAIRCAEQEADDAIGHVEHLQQVPGAEPMTYLPQQRGPCPAS